MAGRKKVDCKKAYKMLLDKKIDDLNLIEIRGVEKLSEMPLYRFTVGIEIDVKTLITPEGVFEARYVPKMYEYTRICEFNIVQREKLAQWWLPQIREFIRENTITDKLYEFEIKESYGTRPDEYITTVVDAYPVSLIGRVKWLLSGILAYNSPYLHIADYALMTKNNRVIIQAVRIDKTRDDYVYYYITDPYKAFKKYVYG
ncbi:MAG: hypothetical protein QXQ91_02515 [Nanopusillaceae archaeon]